MTDKNTRKPRTFNVDSGKRDAARPSPEPKRPGGHDTAGAAQGRGEKNFNDRSRAGSSDTPPRKPRTIEKPREIIMQPAEAVDEAYQEIEALTPPPLTQTGKKRFGWGKLALGAFTTLVAIAIGMWVDQLIRELFSRNDWLGWVALGITAIGVFALLIVIMRELAGIWRLRSVEHLRELGEAAKKSAKMSEARQVTSQVVAIFANRPETAHGRALLAQHDDAIMDAADLIALVERDLLAPLDRTARVMVMQSAKRVSVVTAVSPRALVDVGFVLFENMRLIRRIAEHYGGKPGFFSSLRLFREVVTHLATTGAIAVGDGLMQQVIGHGLAARLSARLGEGVVNGLLTARIGIAAVDVCRPLEFDAEKRPGVGDFLSELTKWGKNG